MNLWQTWNWNLGHSYLSKVAFCLDGGSREGIKVPFRPMSTVLMIPVSLELDDTPLNLVILESSSFCSRLVPHCKSNISINHRGNTAALVLSWDFHKPPVRNLRTCIAVAASIEEKRNTSCFPMVVKLKLADQIFWYFLKFIWLKIRYTGNQSNHPSIQETKIKSDVVTS